MDEIIKFKSSLKLDANSSLKWNYRIPVPNKISEQFKRSDKRIIYSINNDTKSIHAALMPDGSGGHYLMINKDLRKKMSLKENDALEITISKDNSPYGTFVPPEFKEVNEQYPTGSKHFHSLTIGKQRTLLHLIAKPKSEEKRIEKAIIVFEYLETAHGKLDFKELNEAFKQSRFK